VTLETKRNVIRVEQIRELLVFMTLTSQHRGRKVALLDPADRLHPSAANALLKTLEEPPGDGVFVLVSDMPGRLPATVRSRCVRLDVRPPPMEEVVSWLLDQGFQGDTALAATLSRGRPLQALAWDQGGRLARRLLLFERLESLLCGRCEVLAAAEDFAAAEARESVDLLAGWAQDLLRLRLAGADAELESSDLRLRLLRLAQSLSPHWLLQRLDEAHRGRQLCDTPVVPQLLVEDLLVGWNGPGVSV
jgi:DNA polymerase-3 subunit delta'